MPRPFHLALPVADLGPTRTFYTELLGCATGREDTRWVDLDFFGHQVTLHLVDASDGPAATNAVDGDAVPARHFGIILEPADWQALAQRLEAEDANFIIRPRTRFAGSPGEQSTLFVRDPSGNALEFKSFADDAHIFATEAGA
ncbi:MAG: VOC family protein [Pseudomonadota bacterium]